MLFPRKVDRLLTNCGRGAPSKTFLLLLIVGFRKIAAIFARRGEVRIILWSVFLLLLLILWVRELSVYNHARRDGGDLRRDRRRLRRRTLGVALLLLLGVCYDLSNVFIAQGEARTAPESLKIELGFYAVFFLLFILLLIVAAKDLRDVAETFVDDQRRMTLQALLDLDKELRAKKGTDSDELIPRLEFRRKEEEAEKEKEK